MALKAFQVQDEWGDAGGVVIFAERNVEARRIGAGDLSCEFGDVSCRRKPEWDQCAETGVPTEAMLADGWWLPCHAYGCYRRVTSDDGAVLDGDAVYCSQECHDKAKRSPVGHHARPEMDGGVDRLTGRRN